MSKKYEIPETEAQMASEPVAAYAVQTQAECPQVIMELSNFHKKEHLRNNLHPSTAEYLESVEWMEGMPFLVFEDNE